MHANGSDSVYDFWHANIFLSVRMYVSMQRTSDKVGLKVCGYSDSSTWRPSSWHYTHTEIIHPTYSKLLQHTIQDLSKTFLGQLCTFWETLKYTANLHAAKFKNSQLSFEVSNQRKHTTMSQEFTVRWKVQMNSLPLSNQNFPKRTNHIPGLSRTTFISKDFQRPEFAAFKLKYQYFQGRGGSLAHYLKADWKKKNCKSIPITDPNYPLVNFLQLLQSMFLVWWSDQTIFPTISAFFAYI